MIRHEFTLTFPHGSDNRTVVSEKALGLGIPNGGKVCERALKSRLKAISFCPFCPSLSLYFGCVTVTLDDRFLHHNLGSEKKIKKTFQIVLTSFKRSDLISSIGKASHP
jgi:hypothetical protein